MPGRTDFLVVCAVLRNRSAEGLQGKYREFFSKRPSDDEFVGHFSSRYQSVGDKFPKRVNWKFTSVEQGEKVDGPG